MNYANRVFDKGETANPTNLADQRKRIRFDAILKIRPIREIRGALSAKEFGRAALKDDIPLDV
jgi:hypothetical protein